MVDDEYCTKCGLETADRFARTYKGVCYCADCWIQKCISLGVLYFNFDKEEENTEMACKR